MPIRPVLDDPPRRLRFAAAVLSALVPPAVPLLGSKIGGLPSGPELAFAVFIGAVLPFFYWHGYRLAGLAPFALTAAFASAVLGRFVPSWEPWCTAVAVGCLAAGGVAAIRASMRFADRSASVAEEWVCVLVGLALVVGYVAAGKGWIDGLPPEWLNRHAANLGLILAALAAIASWLFLFRPAIELAVEPPLWLMYRIRGVGPALEAVPDTGPCLVVANHACWFDPFILAKVLPRPVTPMMTSKFYDIPKIRWLAGRVFGVIRVPEKTFRQDAPEIAEAVAALDRGACVVIFPEGFLRRSEEKPLKRFGRGVWQILKARPGTPVFACWIEGGWGSYCSYRGGPPTKNKRPDLRRPIGVAVTGPVRLDPATLEDHLATRLELMNRVSEARTHLGLPPLPRFERPPAGEKDEDAEAR